MNILSCFDGISCGQVALQRVGIPIDNYFASEIDPYAIKVTMKNFPNTKQLGDITTINSKQLPKIDLLFGGSPCQGFSFAGKQLNFNDPRSKLFFEYVSLLTESQPKYFLLENVAMKKESEDIITKYMGVKPILINSNLFSAQNRKRLYWTNIPIDPLPNSDLCIKDILESKVDDKYYVTETFAKTFVPNTNNPLKGRLNYATGKSSQLCHVMDQNGKAACCSAGSNGRDTYIQENIYYPNTNTKRIRKLTPIEWERLQTLPDNYSDGISDSRRYHAIGNSWTVDVISHIFKGI